MAVLERFTPAARALPPGAAVAQLGGALRLFGTGQVELAGRMRVQALAWYGLDTAVGIGPSWAVAAMASARTGPGGIRLVVPERTGEFLGPLPIEESYGIRRAQAEELRSLDVETVGQLAGLPGATALRILGHAGRELQERAHGIDRRAVVPGGGTRSTSVRADFPVDALDGVEIRAAALRLATELGARLRAHDQAARRVTVTLRMADRRELARTRTLPGPSAHTDDLRTAVYAVLDAHALQRARIRRLTLTAENIVDATLAHTQLSLDRGREARLRAEPVIDALNERCGPGAVGPAACLIDMSGNADDPDNPGMADRT
ncbi:DNA polymerase Y family protein [Streptomyces sp. NPDC002643]